MVQSCNPYQTIQQSVMGLKVFIQDLPQIITDAWHVSYPQQEQKLLVTD